MSSLTTSIKLCASRDTWAPPCSWSKCHAQARCAPRRISVIDMTERPSTQQKRMAKTLADDILVCDRCYPRTARTTMT